MMKFGDFCKAKRKELGVTLRQFCEENDFYLSEISRIERNRVPAPDVKQATRIANALRLRAEDKLRFYRLVEDSYHAEYAPLTDEELLSHLPFHLHEGVDPDEVIDHLREEL